MALATVTNGTPAASAGKAKAASASADDPLDAALLSGGLRVAFADGSFRLSETAGGASPTVQSLSRFVTALRRHFDYGGAAEPGALDALVGACQARLLDDMAGLHAALRPLVATPAPEAAAAAGGSLESLLRVLLRVEPLQPRLLRGLLEKLPECAADAAPSSQAALAEDLPRLLLHTVRWIDHVVEPEALAATLLECVQVVDAPRVRQDIVSFLPEMVPDRDMAATIRTLQGLCEDDSSLMVPMLDAFSNTALPTELLGSLVDSVLDMLESVATQHLPVLVKFALQTATKDNAKTVVSRLRQHLRFNAPDAGDAEGLEVSGGGGTGSYEALTLDAMRSGLQFRDDVCAVFRRELAATSGPSNHTVTDLWVAFCMSTIPHQRKVVEKLIRKKVCNGDLPEALLVDALRGRSKALQGVFAALLQLAEALLPSVEPSVARFGAALYRMLFSEFDDPARRQDVVFRLITHAGSGVPREVGAAFEVLAALVRPDDGGEASIRLGQRIAALRPYAAFLKQLLDYVETLAVAQVRTLFKVLFVLGDESGDDDDPALRASAAPPMDDVMIFVRKQMSQSNLKRVRIGVVGAIAFIARRGRRRPGDAAAAAAAAAAADDDGDGDEGMDGHGDGEAPRETEAAMDMLRTYAATTTASVAFLFDELKTTILSEDLGRATVRMLMDTYVEDFQSLFFVEVEPTHEGSAEVGLLKDFRSTYLAGAVCASVQHNLDFGRAGVALQLLPIVAERDKAFTCAFSRSSNWRPDGVGNSCLDFLCPMLSLIGACEINISRDLAELDALLGCPLVLASEEDVEGYHLKTPQVQEAIFRVTVHAANWIRELCNVFVLDTAEESPMKLLARLRSLCGITDRLIGFLLAAPDVDPLGCFGDGKKAARGGGGKAVAAAAADDDDDDADDADDADADDDADDADEDGPAKKKAKTAKGKGKAKAPSAEAKAKARAKRAATGAERKALCAEKVSKALRPLSDMAVTVLAYIEVQRKTTDTMDETLSVDAVALSSMPDVLMLLVGELHGHLKASLEPRKAMPLGMASNKPAKAGSGGGGGGGGGGGAAGAGAGPASNLAAPPERAAPRPARDLLKLYLSRGVFSALRVHMCGGGGGGAADGDGDGDGDDVDAAVSAAAAEEAGSEAAAAAAASAGPSSARAMAFVQKAVQCIRVVFGCRELYDDYDGRARLRSVAWHLAGFEKGDLRTTGAAFLQLYDVLESFLARTASIELTAEIVGVLEAIAEAAKKLRGTADGPDAVSAADARALAGQLSRTCLGLLQKEYAAQRGAAKPRLNAATLGSMVKAHLKWAPRPLDALEVMATDVLPLLYETERGVGPVATWPTLTAGTLVYFYGPALERLVDAWNEAPLTDSALPVEARLLLALKMVLVLEALLLMTKNPVLERRPVLVNAVKHGRRFVESFLKAMPFFELAFATEQDDVLAVWKRLQTCTRQLNTLCSHGKLAKDAAMARENPAIKKALETLIYRVKSVCEKHHCRAAFWVGNLKNRTIGGGAVQAQEADSDGESGSGSGSDAGDAEATDSDDDDDEL